MCNGCLCNIKGGVIDSWETHLPNKDTLPFSGPLEAPSPKFMAMHCQGNNKQGFEKSHHYDREAFL